VGVARLLKLLGILGVELVLSKPSSSTDAPDALPHPDTGTKPAW
jgi:HTH-type transcriptional regulator / antitoxin HipB